MDFETLGFVKYRQKYIDLYRLDLPTQGVYLLSNKEGALWIEYEDYTEDNTEPYQSVGFGTFTYEQIKALIDNLLNCKL
jgi:hypothetical protein